MYPFLFMLASAKFFSKHTVSSMRKISLSVLSKGQCLKFLFGANVGWKVIDFCIEVSGNVESRVWRCVLMYDRATLSTSS